MMEVYGDNTYRLFHQALEKVKLQLNPEALQLICRQLTERRDEEINQERLSLIIHQQFGECNFVMLIFILTLLSLSNHDTFITYQQVFGKDVTSSYPRKREEELEEQLVDLQKKYVKLQKENEQVSMM